MSNNSSISNAQENKWNKYWQYPDAAPKTIQMIWVRSDGFYMAQNDTRNLTKVEQPNPQIVYGISWIAAEDGIQIVSSTLDKPCQPRRDNSSNSFYSGVLNEGDEFQIDWITPADSTFFYSANGTNCTNGMFGGFNLQPSDIEKYAGLTKTLNNDSIIAPQGGYYGTTGTILQGKFQPQLSSDQVDTDGSNHEFLGGMSGKVLPILIGVGVGVLVLAGLLTWYCCSKDNRPREEGQY